MKTTINIGGIEYDLVPTKITQAIQPNTCETPPPPPELKLHDGCRAFSTMKGNTPPEVQEQYIKINFQKGEKDDSLGCAVEANMISLDMFQAACEALIEAYQDARRRVMLQNMGFNAQLTPDQKTN